MKKHCKKISVLFLTGILFSTIFIFNFTCNTKHSCLPLNKEFQPNLNIESYSYGNDDERTWY